MSAKPQPPSNDDPPHRKHLRAGRQSAAFEYYAITKAVEGRRPILTIPSNASLILESLQFARKHDWIRLIAFCVMPDHYHLLVVLQLRKTLSQFMSSIGKFTALRMTKPEPSGGGIWQEGFHDHRCRDTADALDRLTYIENNPVRAGLVSSAEKWRYSSAYAANAHLLDRQWFFENL